MTEGIDYFGRGHLLTGIQERMSLAARRQMFQLWLSYGDPKSGETVLDVGATPDQERRDSNCMIPWLEECGSRVTLYSPEDISGLRDVFPGATLLSSAGFGTSIPVADRAYKWVISSAVLEHVGGVRSQIEFIRECARVGDGLFITTPNRGHWLEFHSKLPVLHWLPRRTHRALLRGLGQQMWADESRLRLLDRRELRAIANEALGSAFRFEIRHVWALGMPSNLVLLAHRRN